MITRRSPVPRLISWRERHPSPDDIGRCTAAVGTSLSTKSYIIARDPTTSARVSSGTPSTWVLLLEYSLGQENSNIVFLRDVELPYFPGAPGLSLHLSVSRGSGTKIYRGQVRNLGLYKVRRGHGRVLHSARRRANLCVPRSPFGHTMSFRRAYDRLRCSVASLPRHRGSNRRRSRPCADRSGRGCASAEGRLLF